MTNGLPITAPGSLTGPISRTAALSTPQREEAEPHASVTSPALDPQHLDGLCNPSWYRRPLRPMDWTLAAALIVLTLVVRWPFIERGETLLHSDEAIVGIMAQDIAEGSRYPIYFYGQRYMGALEAYLIAALLAVFKNPLHALRFGPACVFAAMVAVQFLMLTRWFGRRGGLLGATVLVAGSPMFTQWSISARGGYVEIMLWGSALLWAYSEWFVPPRPVRRRRLHQILLGLLIGSGLWINPAIVLFVAPIVAHALLHKPLAHLHQIPRLGRALNRTLSWTRHAGLPVAALLAVVMLNLVWSNWVAEGEVHRLLLGGLLPESVAFLILIILGGLALLRIRNRTRRLEQCRALVAGNAALIFGLLAGVSPAVVYLIQTTVGAQPIDPSVPLGLRPLWLTGETMVYLLFGLRLLFCADPHPFLDLVTIGRDSALAAPELVTSTLAAGAAWVGFGALATSMILLVHTERIGLSKLLRLRSVNHSPAVLLMLGVASTLALYVCGGCTFDFLTVRYLVPIWVFVPGLLAAVFVSRSFPVAARVAPLCVCAAWVMGQWAMHERIGAPHPLRPVANALIEERIHPATAEVLDAHLLSYLTQQRCRTLEFQPFWSRLGHYTPPADPTASMDYIVYPHEPDRSLDWVRGGWPGPPPPETHRRLWLRLRRGLRRNPDRVEARRPLAAGYELIRLRHPPDGSELR